MIACNDSSRSRGARRRTLWTAACLALAAATCALPRTASAQGDPQKAATAASLFDQANAAMEQKNYATACPLYERVVDLIPDGVGAKLALAECYEASGRLASAYGMYVATEGAALRQNQPERVQKARERKEALKPRLAYLVIEVPDAVKQAPGFTLKKDNADVVGAELGAPVPVDRGEHVLLTSATNRANWEKRFSVNDGERITVRIELGPEGQSGTVTTGPKGDVQVVPPAGGKGKTEKNFFSPLRIAGLGIGITGVVGAAIGIGLGVKAKGLYDDSNEKDGCDPVSNACPTSEGVDKRSDAVLFGNVSTGLVIAGGVLAAGGIVMFAVAPSEDVKVGIAPGYVSVTAAF